MISLAVASTLFAAVIWALSSLVAHAPSRALGTFAFTRTLLAGSSIVLTIVVTIMGGWETIA